MLDAAGQARAAPPPAGIGPEGWEGRLRGVLMWLDDGSISQLFAIKSARSSNLHE
jgi:hypothetical protein